ncbi:MAG: MATE family efflux transporter, partial [Oscillospiraceae bacterium]
MQKSNKMGTMPIPALLGDMALPIMASMLVQALYNIVDSMYIARMVEKEEALSAISISFPLQMLIISVSVGTAVGANALISRLLGEKQRDKASDAAKNSIFLCSIYGIFFFVFAAFFITPYFDFMTKNQTIVTMGTSYSKICLMCAIFPVYSIIGERILQSTGRTVFSMICQMGGALINIILDPIFIFGYFGFPAMGTVGAAIATVLGQFFCFFMVSYFNFKKNTDLDFNFKGFKPNKQIIKDIYKVGLPSIIMQSMGSFMNMGLNSVVASYDVIAISVLGIYFKLQSFVFMPVFGLANAMISIVSFNYGAKNKA